MCAETLEVGSSPGFWVCVWPGFTSPYCKWTPHRTPSLRVSFSTGTETKSILTIWGMFSSRSWSWSWSWCGWEALTVSVRLFSQLKFVALNLVNQLCHIYKGRKRPGCLVLRDKRTKVQELLFISGHIYNLKYINQKFRNTSPGVKWNTFML